ncbi:hypothetical protein [Flammeovirga kamogawensis]|uniref:Uncharacterized protein n=1 Tax=Flammeovirga kamogawensis TaxID=373891 RepID=A0ABX8H157_9BACT|nr:hypothetical protein [Flammeovirga kamogawensis]MBB6462173.1 TRAP-type C4-dicarboxylate transport system permease small subunit [Flammeovirga kamogawensis]QWG09424.1 hypothetical protein KM029_22720 [Flammeovirga kamogawensis]TRX64942.1 hypothetical protein EO216_20630 [Flammeovirga kamogawensis]
MSISKIADYSLILVSLMYSSYVSFLFLSEVSNVYVAAFIAVFIVSLGHHYTFQTIKHYKETKSVSQSILIAIILMGFVFYAEWNGQSIHTLNVADIPTTEKIDSQIDETMEIIHQNANKRNWRNVEQYRTASQQLETLQQEKERILTIINIKSNEAKKLANDFRCFSILLFCVAFIASTLTNTSKTANNKVVTNTISTVPHKNTAIHYSSEVPVTTTTNFEEEIILKIQTGEITDHKVLMKLLRLNVRQANQLLSTYKPNYV